MTLYAQRGVPSLNASLVVLFAALRTSCHPLSNSGSALAHLSSSHTTSHLSKCIRRKIVNNVVTKIATPYSTGHIPCPYGCGRSFKHATQKAIHIRKAHTGERPFVCKVESCKKAFYSSGDLKSHEKTHSGLKPFECPTCGKSLSSRNALKVHTKALHTLDRPFKCDIPGCGMTYMTRLDLDRHMKKHNKWEQKEEKAKMLTLEKRAEKAEKKIRQMEQKLDKKEMSEAKCVNNGFTLQSAGKLVPCQPGDVVPEGVLAFFMPNSAGNNAKLDKLEVIIKRKARKPVVKSASKGQLGKALLVGTGNGVMGDGDGIDAIGNLVPGSANGTSTDGDDTAHGGSEAAAALAMTGGVGAEGRNDEDGAAPTARKGYKRKASSSTDPEATARASRKKLLENKMREEYEKQGFRGSIPFQSWRRGLSSEVVGEFQREVENDIANGAGGSGHGMNAAGDIVNGSDDLTK